MALSSRIALWLAAAALGAEALAPALLQAPQGRRGGDACECLQWRQVYRGARASCGAANEFRFFLNSTGAAAPERLFLARMLLGGEFCQRFYQALHGNVCVNVNQGADEGQWCYVAPACTALGGGAPLPSAQVNWKRCGAQDHGLRGYSPEQLAALAREQDLDLGLLHKESYPLFKGHLWREVQAFWGLRGSVEDMPAALREEMQRIADSGEPHSFDTAEDNHPPHRIVVGRRVYAVGLSASPDPAHPGTWCELSCLSACG